MKGKPSKREVLAVLKCGIETTENGIRAMTGYMPGDAWIPGDKRTTLISIGKHQAWCLREAARCVRRSK